MNNEQLALTNQLIDAVRNGLPRVYFGMFHWRSRLQSSCGTIACIGGHLEIMLEPDNPDRPPWVPRRIYDEWFEKNNDRNLLLRDRIRIMADLLGVNACDFNDLCLGSGSQHISRLAAAARLRKLRDAALSRSTS